MLTYVKQISPNLMDKKKDQELSDLFKVTVLGI